MVQRGAFPGIGAVAGRTQTIEVVGWFILDMAGLAVSRTHRLMIEGSVIPITGVMTI